MLFRSVLALGAERVIDRDADLDVEVDVVADVVGGPRWPALIEALRRGGRYVVSGAIGGPLVELDLRSLYLEDRVLIGATITEPAVFAELVELIEAGAIRPAVAATYPLAAIHDAQRAFMDKRFVGKIVLDVA